MDQISRTGSTGFHGTLMYTWAGNSLDALSTDEKRQFNALTATGLSDGQAYRIARSVVVDNRIVASGGFPIWKDKIFSFSSFDRDWFNATANPSTIAITPEGFAELQAIEETWHRERLICLHRDSLSPISGRTSVLSMFL